MDIRDTETLVHLHLEANGLADWRFQWSTAKVTAGSCNYTRRTIKLSKPLMAQWEESAVENTILHEVAHALTGPGHGHNRKWQRIARSLGCTGDRCWAESDDSPALAPAWVAVCPQGHVSKRGYHRRPTATRSCSVCSSRFDARYILTYQRAAQAA